MHKFLATTLIGLTAMGLPAAAQTQIDLSTQAKRVDFSNASFTKPLQTGTPLPSACTVGQMFFKTDAPAGANLYACTATNTWSVQGGITGGNCWADASSHSLKCQDPSGNVYSVVKTASRGTANQWVDYIGADGTPHTSAANADQLSGPFFCQDTGSSGAYSCNLTPAIAGYGVGTMYWFRANTANTGSATLNLNGLGAKTIVKQANQTLAANDIHAGQWVMATYDGTNLQMQSAPGTVTGSGQLPATAMLTNQGNTVTAGTQDFSQAAHTLPMKTGTTLAMPASCSVGETYFATDAAAGANVYGCTAANTWSPQSGSGGSGSLTVKASGAVAGARSAINIVAGTGIAPVVSDTGSQINVLIPIDTAVTDTRLNAASGADLLVAPVSNSGTAYAGCPAGITPPVTPGMVVHLTPDRASAGGATTFNYCGTGAVALMEADGATNLTSADLAANRQVDIWYDGTNAEWRLKGAASSSGGGSGGSGGGGGSGTVGSGSAGQAAVYATTGTAVSGVGAQAFRSATYGNIDAGTPHGDSNYTILPTDRMVYTNAALTAARTWTLPAASAVNQGQLLCIHDAQGGVTASNTLSLAPAGANTINGGTASLALNVAYESACFTSDGTANWFLRGRPLNAGTGLTLSGSALGVTEAVDTARVFTNAAPLTNTAAPMTPAAGTTSVWVDSTDKVLKARNDAGTVSVTVIPEAGASNNFLTAIGASGAVGKARPACASLSDSGTGCSATLAAVATSGSASDLSTGTLALARLAIFPDTKYSPAANCNSATGGNGWSIGAGGTVACRGGANNWGGYLSITDSAATFAEFTLALPEDWAGGANYPYIRFHVSSADATSGHMIVPQIEVSCQKGDGSTSDDVSFNAAHAASAITLNATANQFWSNSSVQMNAADFTACAAGSLMIVRVGRATDTATSAYFHGASITIPRALTIQGN